MAPDQEPSFVRIAVLENAVEAQLLGSILNQHGIRHRFRSFHDTAYDGLFQLQKGWGEVYARPEDRQSVCDAIVAARAHAIDAEGIDPDN